MDQNFISVVNLNGINYYVKRDYLLDKWIFYVKDEQENFNYIGDQENERLNQLLYIDIKKVYLRNKINIKALSIILGLNITLTSLTGCAIKKEDLKSIDNLPNFSIENIAEPTPEQKDIFDEIIDEYDENKEIAAEITIKEEIDEQDFNLPNTTEQTAGIQPEIMENNQDEILKQTQINIEKYNMEQFQEIIMENQELFNHMCLVMENNNNIPDYAKRIGISTFPRLMLAKNYINFDDYFNKLSILNYLEREPYPDETYAGYYANTPEIVVLKQAEKESTIYHEFEHFNGSRSDYTCHAIVTFQEGKFFNDIYGLPNPINGSLFEEGLVSSFTQDIGYTDCYSYTRDQKIVDLYTYIFGSELMLEAHQSESKIVILMNAVLELGFTEEEVLDIFSRLDLYHRLMYVYRGNNNVDFLSYQIIDDLTHIFEKKYQKSFLEDQTFGLLIDAFMTIEKGYNIGNELLDSGYKSYSKELYEIINNQESLLKKYFPNELNFDPSFKISLIDMESKSFSVLDKNTKIKVELDNNPDKQEGEFQIINLTFEYKDNKLILEDISMENFRFVNYISSEKSEINNEPIFEK